jgi:hypothetical protein
MKKNSKFQVLITCLADKHSIKMTTILYSSENVRKRITDIFKLEKGRRIAISAFVGIGAEAFLPRPTGIILVCWPKAGGTNPETIRKLIRNGINVFFVESLHMKLYWTENEGAIITSANLSTNALGDGNLKEIGVFLKSNEIDIDRIIRSLDPKAVDQERLHLLDKEHNSYLKKNPNLLSLDKSKPKSFAQWYTSPLRTKWKMGWSDSYGELSRSAKKKLAEDYYESPGQEWLAFCKNEVNSDEWILSFMLKKKPKDLKWMYPDFVLDLSKLEGSKEDYPCQAVQAYPNNRYPTPPFKIRDIRFKEALTKACEEFGIENIKEAKTANPSEEFVDLIYKNYKAC